MYAIIRTGGKQYKVQADDEIFIEKIEVEEGKPIVFDEVLAIGGEGKQVFGTPLVEGASVTAELIKQGRGKKIKILRYKPKKGYTRRQGHRQPYTKVRITSVNP